jgi:hypothetical protein
MWWLPSFLLACTLPMPLPLLPGFLPFDSRASFLLTPATLQPLALVASPKLGLRQKQWGSCTLRDGHNLRACVSKQLFHIFHTTNPEPNALKSPDSQVHRLSSCFCSHMHLVLQIKKCLITMWKLPTSSPALNKMNTFLLQQQFWLRHVLLSVANRSD